MKKFGWILLAGLAFSGGLQAQKIEEVLQSVEQYNKELQASVHRMEAAKMEVQTRNNLKTPAWNTVRFMQAMWTVWPVRNWW